MSFPRWGQELMLIDELQAHAFEVYQRLIVQVRALHGRHPSAQPSPPARVRGTT